QPVIRFKRTDGVKTKCCHDFRICPEHPRKPEAGSKHQCIQQLLDLHFNLAMTAQHDSSLANKLISCSHRFGANHKVGLSEYETGTQHAHLDAVWDSSAVAAGGPAAS